MKTIESIPNAARTFEALRSLGYNLNSSIADVIDNAITEKVGAKNIHVYFNFNSKGKIVCRVVDNGRGMREKVLEEAMRLGTNTTYKENDLGKFGMGMKTASLSHCDKLTVISKSKGSDSACFRWDISHIRNTEEWHLHQLNVHETKTILESERINLGTSGTAVLWDDLFLINREYKSYSSKKLAQNFFFRVEEHLKLYLRTVYHRFLDGSLGKDKTIKLSINEEALTPWDPFCTQEPNSQKIGLSKTLTELHFPEYKTPVRLEGYVLPNKEGFSSETAWKDAKGLNSWNVSLR